MSKILCCDSGPPLPTLERASRENEVCSNSSASRNSTIMFLPFYPDRLKIELRKCRSYPWNSSENISERLHNFSHENTYRLGKGISPKRSFEDHVILLQNGYA